MTFSPDGKWFGSIDSKENLHVWNANTVQHMYNLGIRRSYFGSVGRVNCLAFSADSKMVAAGYYLGKIYFMDVATEKFLRESEFTYASGINTIAFSSDGVTLAIGSNNNGVYLLGANTGKR